MFHFMGEIEQVFNQQIFLSLAAMLLLGAITGFIAGRLKLPRITGYLISGIIFGPSIIGIFSESTLTTLEFLPEFALGIVAFIIGGGLSINLLKRLGMRIFIITIFESLGAFVLVLTLLLIFKMPLGAALPLAAIAPATAPAATLAIIKELRCRGTMTETVLAIVALDDAVSIIIFGLIMSINIEHIENISQTIISSLAQSAHTILLSIIVGVLLGLLTHYLIKMFRETTDHFIIILGMVFFGISLANLIEISTLLTNMFIGFALINISDHNIPTIQTSEKLTPALYCLFFVLAGAHLNLKIFFQSGYLMLLWSILFILMRGVGQIGGAFLAALIEKMPQAIRNNIGFTLIPQAGVAIGLSFLLTKSPAYANYVSVVLAVTLMGVGVNEIIGPILTRQAFLRSGEANLDEKE